MRRCRSSAHSRTSAAYAVWRARHTENVGVLDCRGSGAEAYPPRLRNGTRPGRERVCPYCHRLIQHPLLLLASYDEDECGSRHCGTSSCSRRMYSTAGERRRDQRCVPVIGVRVEQHRQGPERRRWELCKPWSCGAMCGWLLRRPMPWASAYASCLPQISKQLALFAAAVQALQAQP
jgi:hypothetical protein